MALKDKFKGEDIIMTDLNSFDEKKVNWQELPGVDHTWLSILNVDDNAKIVDVLFKFSANEKIVLHRHFNHNDLFHIVQMIGMYLMFEGGQEIPKI